MHLSEFARIALEAALHTPTLIRSADFGIHVSVTPIKLLSCLRMNMEMLNLTIRSIRLEGAAAAACIVPGCSEKIQVYRT